MTNLPLLYKKTKTGAIQTSQISYHDDKFIVIFGQLNGKMKTQTTVCTSKNVGKANETTPSQQAALEALAYHAKKLKSGYVLDPSGELVVKLPQKVKVYQDNKTNVIFPCIATTKLDGVNATYWLNDDGSLTITSRGGEVYPSIPHLEAPVKSLMSFLKTTCLNGELYIHGTLQQDITSAVKKPKELSKLLEFHVFEAPLLGGTYAERLAKLKAYNDYNAGVKLITDTVVKDSDALDKLLSTAIATHFEGLVIYNTNAPYEFNTRSSHVFKYKKALDAEYKIISYNTDKSEHPVLICETPEGKPFSVKPKGTDAERKAILANIDDYIGQWYTIEYEKLSKDLIPQKPVGVALRNCSPKGEPKE